jgi:hypothetical protein
MSDDPIPLRNDALIREAHALRLAAIASLFRSIARAMIRPRPAARRPLLG